MNDSQAAQAEQLMAAFAESMMGVDSDTGMYIIRDVMGIDPEVYEWDQGEMIKAIFKKIETMTPAETHNLLAKMALAGGKKSCQIASAVFMLEVQDAE